MAENGKELLKNFESLYIYYPWWLVVSSMYFTYSFHILVLDENQVGFVATLITPVPIVAFGLGLTHRLGQPTPMTSYDVILSIFG